MNRLYSGLAGLILFVACASGQNPRMRADRLAQESLKMVRLEQRAMAQGEPLKGKLAAADSLFLATLKLPPECVKRFVESGESPCGSRIEAFLDTVERLNIPDVGDDPAAAISAVLRESPEGENRGDLRLDGYAAAFQMCLEVERDGTVLQDLLHFLVALGSPLTYRDLGLEDASPERLQELADAAAARTSKMPYSTAAIDFYFTLVKLDSWGGRYSGQENADTLAARLMAQEECRSLLPVLNKLAPVRIGFLGDSNTDSLHWSSAAHFPEIIAAVFRKINPSVTVFNAGKGGDDSGEALARMDRDVSARKPEICFVMLGGNDCMHYGRPDPAVNPRQYRINMSEIVNRLEDISCRPVLMSPDRSPSLSGADLEVFNGIVKELPEVRDSLAAGWIDFEALLAAQPGDHMFAVDRIHLNPEAHLLISRKILEYLCRSADLK